MKPQLLILWVACSALLGSPGIARSNDIEIRTDNARLSVDANDDIRVDTGRIQLNVPSRRSPYYRSPYSIERRRWNNTNFRSSCYGSSRSYYSHQTSQSTGNGVRVYNSTSTQVCE